MEDKLLNKALNITTTESRDWYDKTLGYYRYEASEYSAISKLFEYIRISDQDHFVDIGCGKGRLLFYVNHTFNIKCTGLELNKSIFLDLKSNLASYRKIYRSSKICSHNIKAEEYIIEEDQNLFYFFNPFEIRIFKQVIFDIVKSLKDTPRKIKIILFYHFGDYENFLAYNTPLKS